MLIMDKAWDFDYFEKVTEDLPWNEKTEFLHIKTSPRKKIRSKSPNKSKSPIKSQRKSPQRRS